MDVNDLFCVNAKVIRYSRRHKKSGTAYFISGGELEYSAANTLVFVD
jgi:hypothetical protein